MAINFNSLEIVTDSLLDPVGRASISSRSTILNINFIGHQQLNNNQQIKINFQILKYRAYPIKKYFVRLHTPRIKNHQIIPKMHQKQLYIEKLINDEASDARFGKQLAFYQWVLALYDDGSQSLLNCRWNYYWIVLSCSLENLQGRAWLDHHLTINSYRLNIHLLNLVNGILDGIYALLITVALLYLRVEQIKHILNYTFFSWSMLFIQFLFLECKSSCNWIFFLIMCECRMDIIIDSILLFSIFFLLLSFLILMGIVVIFFILTPKLLLHIVPIAISLHLIPRLDLLSSGYLGHFLQFLLINQLLLSAKLFPLNSSQGSNFIEIQTRVLFQYFVPLVSNKKSKCIFGSLPFFLRCRCISQKLIRVSS